MTHHKSHFQGEELFFTFRIIKWGKQRISLEFQISLFIQSFSSSLQMIISWREITLHSLEKNSSIFNIFLWPVISKLYWWYIFCICQKKNAFSWKAQYWSLRFLGYWSSWLISVNYIENSTKNINMFSFWDPCMIYGLSDRFQREHLLRLLSCFYFLLNIEGSLWFTYLTKESYLLLCSPQLTH